MIKCVTILIVMASSVFSQITLKSQQDLHGNDYANIWGYTDSLGREYAIVGCYTGTSIVEITNPTSPREVVFIPGATSDWHEIQTWDHYAYVVSEANGSGMQIIDLSQLPDTAKLVKTYSTGSWTRTHDLQIRDGYVYLTGANTTSGLGANQGGIRILDLADPINPVSVGLWADEYVHDCYVRDNKIYAANIYAGAVTIIDVTDKSKPVNIKRFSYPGGFTHNTALSDDSQTLFTTDETSNPPGKLRAWSISDINNPTQFYSFGTNAIVHNVYAKGRFAYASYYQDGIKIWNISNLSTISLKDTFDTYPSGSAAGFNGAWGVYPYFPSGNIVVSNIEDGLFVLNFAGQETGTINGTVKDSKTNLPVAGAKVIFLQDNLTRKVNASGAYSMKALSGLTTVKVTAPGYKSKYQEVTIPVGGSTTLDFTIDLKPLVEKPTNFRVYPEKNRVTVKWGINTNDPKFMRYRVYGGTSPSPTQIIDSTSVRKDSIRTIFGLTNGTTYYFRMAAVDSNFNQSEWTDEKSVVVNPVPPQTPTDLTAIPDSGRITLAIGRNNFDADFLRYRVYMGSSPNPLTAVDSGNGRDSTIRVIRNLTNGIRYFFRVTAVDSDLLESPSIAVNSVPNVPALNISTSIIQNPGLTRYIEVVMIAELALLNAPTVKIVKGSDTTSIAMTNLNGNPNVFRGSYQLKNIGNHVIITRAISASLYDTTNIRGFVVAASKAIGMSSLTSSDGAATLIIPESAHEKYYIGTENQQFGETVYQFSPDGYQISDYRIEMALPNALKNYALTTVIYQKENGSWTPMETQYLARQNKLVAKTNRLGEFKIGLNSDPSHQNVVVKDFSIAQNYPNPFNPTTTIRYDVPTTAHVSVIVYNLLGQKTRSLVDQSQLAGRYDIVWDGKDERGNSVASGIYLYRLQTDGFVQTRKMILIK